MKQLETVFCSLPFLRVFMQTQMGALVFRNGSWWAGGTVKSHDGTHFISASRALLLFVRQVRMFSNHDSTSLGTVSELRFCRRPFSTVYLVFSVCGFRRRFVGSSFHRQQGRKIDGERNLP